jgi:hypothetical protein
MSLHPFMNGPTMTQQNRPPTDVHELTYPADALAEEIDALQEEPDPSASPEADPRPRSNVSDGSATDASAAKPRSDLDPDDAKDRTWPTDVLMFSWEGALVDEALAAEADYLIHQDLAVEDDTMDAMLQGADRAIAVLSAKNSHESAEQLRVAAHDLRHLDRAPQELSEFEHLVSQSAAGACDFRSYSPDQIAAWCDRFDISVPTMLAAMSPDQNTAVFEHDTSSHALLVRAADHEWADFRMSVWDASDDIRASEPPAPHSTEV